MSALKKQNRQLGRNRLVFATVALVLSLAAITSTARAQEQQSGLAAPIEGTWIVQVHRVNQDVTFTALQSFTAGGVTLATGTLDRTPLPAISPLYGTWKRAGANSYETSLCFFIFDEAGDAVAMLQNYETFHLTQARELEGTGDAYLCDTNGNNCVHVESLTFTGKHLDARQR